MSFQIIFPFTGDFLFIGVNHFCSVTLCPSNNYVLDSRRELVWL